MDLIERLRRVPLFQHLALEQLQQVAHIAEQRNVPSGTHLTRQGDLGATLYLFDSGEALIHHVDENSFMRPVGMLHAGDHFGVTALFLGEPRDASVTVVADAVLWQIGRPDFQDLLTREPQLARRLLIPRQVLVKLRAPRYNWLEPQEIVIHHSRRHWLVLVEELWLTTIVVMGFVLLILALFFSRHGQGQLLILVPPVLLLYAPIFLWHWMDWRNDYLAVTNLRIAHHERVVALYEALEEIPLGSVQNVDVQRSGLYALLDCGDITIHTAAAAGKFSFGRIPRPQDAQSAILEQLTRAKATQHALQRQRIRLKLSQRLTVENAEALPEAVPGTEGIVEGLVQSEAPLVKPGLLPRAVSWLGAMGFLPRMRMEDNGQITWRRHWVFLILRMSRPFPLALLLGAVTLLGFFGFPPLLLAWLPFVPYMTLLLMVISLGWLWWELLEWSNDRYILTADRIIDIKKRVFPPKEDRREASLSKIQNVSLQITSLAGVVFNYGNVIVQTAGPGEFSFLGLPDPREVQREIFRRMEGHRVRAGEAESAQRQSEIADWLSVYDELRRGRPAVPTANPQTATASTKPEITQEHAPLDDEEGRRTTI